MIKHIYSNIKHSSSVGQYSSQNRQAGYQLPCKTVIKVQLLNP